MKLSDFDYHLPKELIAQFPPEQRDQARLLVLDRRSGKIEHRIFRDITGYLKPGDLLVLNDTKVLNCRIRGNRRSGGKVEVFLLKHKGGLVFEAMVKPARIKTGEKIIFSGSQITCSLTARNEVRFDSGNVENIYALGIVPLPPYIKREAKESDYQDYQTVYARELGSVASPTAGLHFTPELLEEIKKSGAELAYLTLHVGSATFKPVSCENIIEHKMGSEYFTVNTRVREALKRCREDKGRVFAVGTTSCRTLETYAANGSTEGETDLFIYPGYDFRMVDCLLTNFHLPKTTLFILVCAFCGRELAQKAYAEAIKEKYRFYSYGDAMLIL